MTLTELAPAKVNLYLHVGPPGADGYHVLASLMVFADVGDRVSLIPGGADFAVTGPFAAGLAAESANLVTLARDQFLERFGGRDRPIGLVLEKALPIAAGLGGGSADAAATLRLLAEAWALSPDTRTESGALGELARALGADVAACLASTSISATGRGDRLAAAPPLPTLHAVLVNPLVPTGTAEVYQAFDQDRAVRPLAGPEPGVLSGPEEVAAWLGGTRNDLEAPAMRLKPEIGEVLKALRRSDTCLLARMSGSGATCFALCRDGEAAAALARTITRLRSEWWVKPCQLAATSG